MYRRHAAVPWRARRASEKSEVLRYEMSAPVSFAMPSSLAASSRRIFAEKPAFVGPLPLRRSRRHSRSCRCRAQQPLSQVHGLRTHGAGAARLAAGSRSSAQRKLNMRDDPARTRRARVEGTPRLSWLLVL